MFLRFMLLILVSFSVCAAEYGNVLVSEVRTIYDGDSFRVNIDGWPDIIGKHQAEKILARQAKQHTVALLRSAKVIELTNIQRGKYFRILANVIIDGESLGDSLIKNGLARYYVGGKRGGWCSAD